MTPKLKKVMEDFAQEWARDRMTIINECSTCEDPEEEPIFVYRETLKDVEAFVKDVCDALWITEKGINC